VLQDQTIEIGMVWTPGRQLRSTGATHRDVGEQRAQTMGFIPGKQPESIDCTRLVQSHRKGLFVCIMLVLRHIGVNINSIQNECKRL